MNRLAMSAVLLGLFCLASLAGTQKKPTDVRLVDKKPTVYVSFVRAGPRRPLENWESDRGVWLRIHNNTKWRLVLNAGGVPDPSYGDAVLMYRIKRIEGEGFVPVGYQRHVSSVIQLESGRSLEFSIPREHLAEGLAIEILFNYEWELNKDGTLVRNSEPQHNVSFDSSLIQ